MQAIVFADAPGPASEAAFCALAPAAVRIVAEQAITNRVMWMDFATSASPVASIHCKRSGAYPVLFERDTLDARCAPRKPNCPASSDAKAETAGADAILPASAIAAAADQAAAACNACCDFTSRLL